MSNFIESEAPDRVADFHLFQVQPHHGEMILKDEDLMRA